ncbi:P-loop containing nucleoside triphosphate hydrolase protein [Pilobolus umbonatus]|nr:P-loop containing nucleoside triphosphate hydrolase protein [Pilobolus umbonatus]
MPATAAQKSPQSEIKSKKMTITGSPSANETKKAKEILSKLSAASDADRESVAEELAAFVKANGVLSLVKCNIIATLTKEFTNKKSAAARQGAIAAFAALTNNSINGQVEPFILPFLTPLLDLQADKQAAIKNSAAAAATNFVAKMNPNACTLTIPYIILGLGNSCKWQTKMLALELLVFLTKTHPKEFFVAIPSVIPVVSDCMWDTKADVKKQATETMATICSLVENKDIERFIPAVIKCINHPENVPETIHLLGATTFVQEVDSATLSIMVPLLGRGLNERATSIKRKAALIIDNMSKLVDDPDVAAPFLPLLLPALEKVQDVVADPECRGVVQKALATLQRVGNPGKEVFTIVQKQAKVESSIKELLPADIDAQLFAPVVKYLNDIALELCVAKNFFKNVWLSALSPYAQSFFSVEDADNLAVAALNKCEEAVTPKDPEEEDDEGEDLCNCEFSLAYGAKILLNRTALRLKRGRRYGLCGANGCGKSTLMRAIANEQVEGFPPRSELKTVYVEHDIDGSEADTPLVEFILSSEGVETKDPVAVKKMLLEYGFSEIMVTKMAIGELSGGWKMKLALARAMLMNADILLLDEPTNHLDVVNVAWLENYLLGLKTVTSIIVSHDSGFLDHVCSDIIHYEPNYKLKRYGGNLSEFVKKVPRAASYYSLEATQIKFSFPEPGFLEGIKTKERAIMKMKNVDFQYPGSDRKQLLNISFQCSLASRVAVIGPNGAGKSTLIKLLTGEIESEIGTVWKHPNLRIAYVAQHAFHHIEKHLDATPNEYIQWRYATGEDREELDKNERNNEENEKVMQTVFVIDGEKRTVEEIVGRRKLKQSYEYEVSWMGRSSVDNTWISRQKLEDMGFGKKIAEVDSAEAAKMGLNRPLTAKEIEKHLSEVGLEPEFATHSRIRGLSGGQKVKLVIGAAMWNKPHMLVLDEPTNYLDRESLGALAMAIKDYGGGVVIVTHNREFTEALCNEVWMVDAGRLTPSGHNWVSGNGTTVVKEEAAEDMVDAQGNTVKAVEKKKKLSSKELRKKKKDRMERRKRGEEVYTTDEDL